MGEDYFQPIGCFAAKGATRGVTLAKLIIQAILLLEEAGMKIIALVCDGAKTNRRMWKEFGITGKRTSLKNFMQNPFDDTRKVFILSDTPHLFKCIRNRAITHDLDVTNLEDRSYITIQILTNFSLILSFFRRRLFLV